MFSAPSDCTETDMTTIFDRIKQDHETQRMLMKKLQDTQGDSDERRSLFEQFVTEYKAHAAAEEHAFYAPMLKEEDTTDQSRHSIAEHHEAMELVEELEKTDMSSPEWLKTFKKLVHENEHHMEEEENDVFPLAKESIDDTVLSGMLAEFNARKEDEVSTA
jgi:hypothetical protein